MYYIYISSSIQSFSLQYKILNTKYKILNNHNISIQIHLDSEIAGFYANPIISPFPTDCLSWGGWRGEKRWFLVLLISACYRDWIGSSPRTFPVCSSVLHTYAHTLHTHNIACAVLSRSPSHTLSSTLFPSTCMNILCPLRFDPLVETIGFSIRDSAFLMCHVNQCMDIHDCNFINFYNFFF